MVFHFRKPEIPNLEHVTKQYIFRIQETEMIMDMKILASLQHPRALWKFLDKSWIMKTMMVSSL